MHNKLLVADGVMAIVGGRNMANEYFMQQPGGHFLDLDTLAVGAVLPSLASMFDQYWNSPHALPVGAVAASALTPQQLAADFRRHTEAAVLPEFAEGPDRFGQRPAFEHMLGRAGL